MCHRRDMDESRIFHITEPGLWQQASALGVYDRSTRDAALDHVGFIHCSFREQVETVANYLYADWDGELLLLEIDRGNVEREIRVENLDGGTEGFPHIYGPLPTRAVTNVHQLVRRSNSWKLPPDVPS